MKKYERLTDKTKTELLLDCHDCPYCGVEYLYDCHIKIANRLAELEDKIENGTLIELPCKVGDIVYQFDNGGEIYEAMILDIAIYNGKPYYETCGVDFDNRAIGESISLTKAEAEAKLRELRGGINDLLCL